MNYRNFLPSLLPVKVEESTAKGWFASLASAVEFMHLRGVVHNDIK
jgi:serine/threonine-protein kinase GIN4